MGVSFVCLAYGGPREDGSEEEAPWAEAWWAEEAYLEALRRVRDMTYCAANTCNVHHLQLQSGK